MKNKRKLSGKEAETWFREFASKTAILVQPNYKLESLVRLLDEQLQLRLNLAMLDVHPEIPNAPDYLENIRAKRSIEINPKERKEFSKYLLDRVVAADEIVEVKNNRGQNTKIAVDVTTNYSEEEEKLNKVRGLPERPEYKGSNANKNIPFVRKQLGIDKHLILVLNNEIDKLPSYEKLLGDIYAFANERSNTKSLNLVDVPEQERFVQTRTPQLEPQKLWNKFSIDLPEQIGPENSTKVCIRAIRAGVDKATVLKMLEHDPQCKKLSTEATGTYARAIYSRAVERIELTKNRNLTQQEVNRRGLKAARVIVERVGKDGPNDERTFTSNRISMKRQGEDFSIEIDNERGKILDLKDGQLKGSLTIHDMKTFEELAEDFQKKMDREAGKERQGESGFEPD
jgi:hypothetical protein